MKPKTLKANLIGLGKIAWSLDKNGSHTFTHANAYLKNKSFNLSAGYSPKIVDRKSFLSHHNVNTYSSLDLMLASEKPDIVSVCSPVNAHYQNCTQLINFKIHKIWLEKPPFKNIVEHRRILKLIDQSKVSNVCVNFFRRFLPPFIDLKRYLKNKNITQIVVTYSQGLLENGVHYLDLVQYFTSAKSFKVIGKFSPKHLSPSFSIKLDTGCTVHFIGSETHFHDIEMTILAGNQKIIINNNEEIIYKKKAKAALAGRKYHFLQHKVVSLNTFFKNYNSYVLSAIENNTAFITSNLKTSYFAMDVINNIKK